MKSDISLNNYNLSESSHEQSWREFLGKEFIPYSIGKGYEATHPKHPEIVFSISENELEEIRASNDAIQSRRETEIQEKVASTDYLNLEWSEEDPRWKEYLGKIYLRTDWNPYRIQDIWNPEIWHLISWYEEYREIELVNEKYQLKAERISDEQLSEKGINDYIVGDRGYRRGNYREKLYTALTENNLTINEVPEYINNLPVKAKNSLLKKEHLDMYEQTIVNFLKKYKNNSFEKTYIPNHKFIEIENLIVKGNFDTDKLLMFSEQLQSIQKRNFLQYHKRIYRYGYQYGKKNFRTTPPFQKEISCLRALDAFFKKGYSIEDLWDTPEHFLERLSYSLKQKIFLANYQGWGEYYWEYIDLGISKEKLDILQQEVKDEWKDLFLEKVQETVNFEKDLSTFLNTKHCKEKEYENNIKSIWENSRNINEICRQIARSIYLEKRWGDEGKYNETYRDKIVHILETYILEGIHKIRKKERIDKLPYNATFPEDFSERKETYWVEKEHRSNRDIRYVYVLDSLIEQKAEILKTLESEITHYDPETNPEKVNRYDERQAYRNLDIQEYLESYDHKKEFIIKRVQNTLSENIAFQNTTTIDREKVMEELSPQLMATSKETLYTLLFKETQKSVFYYPVRLPQAMRSAKLALFIPGYATTLKQLYPDDQERTKIRQTYIQTISKELLLEIKERLLSEDNFVAKEYCMRNALVYVYKRYWGEEEISLDLKWLQTKIYDHEVEQYKNILSPFEIELKEKITTPYESYKQLYSLIHSINSQTFFFLRNTPTHIQTKPKKGIKKEYEDIRHSEYKEEIASQLSPEIKEVYTSLWEKFEEIKLIILQEMVNQRSQENFAGRIKRMIEQTLQKKFWILTGSPEQIDFMYTYLESILESIILDDIRSKWLECMYPEDLQLLSQKILQPAIEELVKTKDKQLSENLFSRSLPISP